MNNLLELSKLRHKSTVKLLKYSIRGLLSCDTVHNNTRWHKTKTSTWIFTAAKTSNLAYLNIY